MRQIGTLTERALASRFAAYLITEDISCEAESEEDGTWSIWVHDEDQIDEARERLAKFTKDPDSEEYAGREAEAERMLRREQQRRIEAQRNTVDVRTTGWGKSQTGPAPFVTTLIIIAAVITLFTQFGNNLRRGSLQAGILSHMAFVTRDDYAASKRDPLANVKKGQLWRTVTPIFAHGDPLHLIFNMFMLFQLGRRLELTMGAPRFALMVLMIAVLSNTAQAMTPESIAKVMGGPFFFGMSGVVYGLFGYAWLRGQSDPASGYYIPASMAFLMIGWMFMGMVFPQMNFANMCHVAGLITGMALAQFY